MSIESAKDIVDNLRAIRGATFAEVVTLTATAQGLLGMIIHSDLPDDQKRDLRQQTATFCAHALAAITRTNGIDHEEVTQWSTRVFEAMAR